MALDSLPLGYRAIVYGASGGIGAALVRLLAADERCAAVYAGSRRNPAGDASEAASSKMGSFRFDLEDESSIEASVAACSATGPLHLVVVATGVLHDGALQPEKTWRSLSAEALRQAFSVNTIGPALIAKHALAALARGDKAVLAVLSARVGSIGDNRLGGWYAYRASKAALNMLVRTFAIELGVRNKTAICVALHPGTVDTGLSRPFSGNLDPGKLFTPERSARHLLQVVDKLTPAGSGGVWAWDGQSIPY